MPVEPRRAKDLFAAALELPPADRAALLERECGEDAELRRRVDVLLAACEHPHPALEQPLPAPSRTGDGLTADQPGAGTIAGTVVAGRYKLLEEIGEGGMGTVWMAEQREPVKRLVALKLIKAGMDSRAVLARFEAERQALALMDHPNIAKVLDGGTWEMRSAERGVRNENQNGVPSIPHSEFRIPHFFGRPFFVMELVKGLPLTEYCDARRLSVRERLELFGQVCSAVQHAHQKGIIHRDLKPSNILVTEHDGKPVPKVIDFGLAKALAATGALTDKTLHTAFGAVVGTPLYMAPEQVGINALDVDTRTDIYALGVILYELLTGTTPLEKKRLREAAWDEMRRLIREEEPPRPSIRLSSSEALPSLAAGRQIEPARLTKLVRGELDWIVMKALEKDRNRRYETANGLAADVQRHLKGESVQAVPPSAVYRLRKFVRRNRGPVTAAAVVVLVLTAGVLGTTIGLVRANDERRRAHMAEANAVAQARTADQQRTTAIAQKERAEKAEDQARQEAAVSRSVRDFLQADLLRQADVISQAEIRRLAGDRSPAKENPTINELLDRAAAGLAPDKIEDRFPGQPRLQAEILHTVGRSYGGVGNFDKAIPLLERAAALYQSTLGPNDPATLECRHQVAVALLIGKDRASEAIPMFERVRDARVARLGASHEATLDTRIMLGLAYAFGRKGAEAIAELKPALETAVKALGPDHIHVLTAEVALAEAYQTAGRPADAIAQCRAAWGHAVRMLSPDHPYYQMMQQLMAEMSLRTGRPADAIPLFEAVLEQQAARVAAGDRFILYLLQQLSRAYQETGQPNKTVALLRRTLDIRLKFSPSDPATQRVVQSLAQRYAELGRDADAEAVSREHVAAVREKAGAGSHAYAVALMYLGRALLWRPGVPAGAEDVTREAVAVFRQAGDASSFEYSSALSNRGKLLLQQGKYAEAEPVLRECRAVREKLIPGSWGLANTTSMLGGSLLGQSRYDEAEPLLRTAYADLTRPRTDFHPILDRIRFAEAADRLADLCEQTGRPEEAATWRAERAKYESEPAPPPREWK